MRRKKTFLAEEEEVAGDPPAPPSPPRRKHMGPPVILYFFLFFLSFFLFPSLISFLRRPSPMAPPAAARLPLLRPPLSSVASEIRRLRRLSTQAPPPTPCCSDGKLRLLCFAAKLRLQPSIFLLPLPLVPRCLAIAPVRWKETVVDVGNPHLHGICPYGFDPTHIVLQPNVGSKGINPFQPIPTRMGVLQAVCSINEVIVLRLVGDLALI
nr:unnamed protein product [Digitaria exilis]